jgi:hypothetical protein
VWFDFNLVQIPDKRLDDDLYSDEGDAAFTDRSSTIEEIRDDEDKVVRPRPNKRLAV